MNYYDQDERRRRVWGIIWLVFYLALCAGVMFTTYTIALPETEMGILVDFGAGDTGVGEEDLAAGDLDTQPPASIEPPAPTEPVMTTDDRDAPEVVPEPRPTRQRPAAPPSTPEPTPEREVDRRALFPGRTENSNAASQGTTPGTGNQGTPQAPVTPAASATEGGSGSSGFSLEGRYLVGALPRPAYNVQVEGRVVIRITVNSVGTVTGAVYEQAGSTTNHGELVRAARTAALRARFTPNEVAEVQTGTITYIFRLN